MKDKKDNFFQSLQMYVGNSVSYDLSTATEYLVEEEIDVDNYVNKGINEINKALNKVVENKNKSLFFKRVVLAAEIINQLHRETTFGHVKLQKLMYLCEEVSNMEISRRYIKQAAGPYDRKFMHSIDKELKRLSWFKVEVIDQGNYKKYKYSPSSKLETYKKYYKNYFENDLSYINWLIKTFKNNPTSKVELVATIYYCLDEFNKTKDLFSKEKLISKVFDWSIEKKKKFTRKDIINAYNWMLNKELYPV